MSSPAIGRVDRRKARTRAALIAAGQRILADRGTTEVAVQDITDEAGVGLGSFYNHFTTKSELFEAAVFDLLDAFAAGIDAARADVQDPAELVAIGIRSTCRLAATRPAVARVLVLTGPEFLVADRVWPRWPAGTCSRGWRRAGSPWPVRPWPWPSSVAACWPSCRCG